MAPEILDQIRRKHQENGRIRAAVGIVVGLVAIFIPRLPYPQGFNPGVEFSLGILIVYSVLYLESLQEQVEPIEEIDNALGTVESGVSTVEEDISTLKTDSGEQTEQLASISQELHTENVFPHNEDVNRHVDRVITADDKELFLLDYSSRYAEEIIDSYIDSGRTIYLLIRNPVNEDIENQERQICEQIKDLYTVFQQAASPNIYVRMYSVEGAVRARKIGNSHLYLGWYHRELIPEASADNPHPLASGNGYDLDISTQQQLWGHDNPMVHFSHHEKGFQVLDNWFKHRIYGPLWSEALTLEELYNTGDLHPELVKWLESGNKQAMQKRHHYFEAVSDDGVTPFGQS